MNRRTLIALAAASALAISAACNGGGEPSPSDLLELRSGGDTTSTTTTRNAFSLPARNLTTAEARRFAVGDSFFTSNWVIAGNSTEARDGLGPLFIAQSCSTCHLHDGRGAPPLDNLDPTRGLVVQISLPTRLGRPPIPDPVYGGSIQDRSILGVPAEAEIHVQWRELPGAYADGEPYSLVEPVFTIANPAYGAPHADLRISPRIGPPVFGGCLLEAIPAERLQQLADPDDADGDGISGRVNVLENGEIGRFGWKTNQPRLETQTAIAAFRFGPAMDRRSASLIDWWPIDRDAIQDAAVAGASAEDIAERQSAATRGLYAIESILAEDLPIDPARLRYAARLAGVIADELAAIRDEWTGAGRDFAYADALAGRGDTAISATLALSDVVRTSIFLTETVGDMQLGKALGVTGDRDPDAIPGLGLSTGADLRGAVQGIRLSFLGTGDHSAVGTLVNDLDDNAYDRMKAALDEAMAAVDALPANIKAGAGDDALHAVRDAIKQVQILYATEVVSLLGISVGFSDNDGDS